jgi:hypothetical protein
LATIVPAIAMFNASNIPEWSQADSSLNEYDILRRARQMRQDDVYQEATKPKTQTSLTVSSYPLVVTAVGRETSCPNSRFVGIGGIVSKIVCLLLILGILLDPWQQHNMRRQDPNASNILESMPVTMPPSTQLIANNSRAFFRKPAFLHKVDSKPTSGMDVALFQPPTPKFATVAMLPQPPRDHKPSPGWKKTVRDASRHVFRFLDRYLIEPASPKIDASLLYSNSAGVPAHYFISQELF